MTPNFLRMLNTPLSRRGRGIPLPFGVALLSLAERWFVHTSQRSARHFTSWWNRPPPLAVISGGPWRPTTGRRSPVSFTSWWCQRPKLETRIVILGAALLFSSTVSTALTLAAPVVEAHVMSKKMKVRKAIANAVKTSRRERLRHQDNGFEAFLELREEDRELMERVLAKLGLGFTWDVDFFTIWDRYSEVIASYSASSPRKSFLLDQAEMSLLLRFLWAKVPAVDNISDRYDVAVTMINCVSSIIDDMRAIGFQAQHAAYRFMVDALLKLERIEAASEVLQSALSAGIKPDPRMYAAIMERYANRHEFSSVQAVYQNFLDIGGIPDTSMFNTLLRSHFRNRHLAAIQVCLEEMDCRSIAMDDETAEILIEGWAEHGDPDRAEIYFVRQVMRAYRPDFRCYAALFRGLGKKGEVARVEALMKRLQNEHTWDPQVHKEHAAVIYSAVVEVYSRDMKVTRASYWFNRGRSEGITLTPEAHNALLAAYLRRSMKKQAEELEIEMMYAGIDPLPVSLSHVVEEETGRASIETADGIFNELRKNRKWLFNPHVIRSSQTDLVNRLLEIAGRKEVFLAWEIPFRCLQRPDRDSYARFFEMGLKSLPVERRTFASGYAKTRIDPEEYVTSFRATYNVAKRAWESLMNTEERFKPLVSPTSDVHAAYMRILAYTRGVKEVDDHWLLALRQGIHPSRGMFHARLEAYVRAGRIMEAVAILDQEKAVHGHSLAEEYSTVLEGCIRSGQPEFAAGFYQTAKRFVGDMNPPNEAVYKFLRLFLEASGHRMKTEKRLSLLPIGREIFDSVVAFHKRLQSTEKSIADGIAQVSSLVAQHTENSASASIALDDLEDQKFQIQRLLGASLDGITHVCFALFTWLPAADKSNRALSMFTELLRAGIVPGHKATTALVFGLAQWPCVRPVAALKLYNALLASNAPVSFSSGRTVIKALGLELRVSDAFTVYQTEMDRSVSMLDAASEGATTERLRRTGSYAAPDIGALVNTICEACVPEAYRLLLDATEAYRVMLEGDDWPTKAPNAWVVEGGGAEGMKTEFVFPTATMSFKGRTRSPDIPYYTLTFPQTIARPSIHEQRYFRPPEGTPSISDVETRYTILKNILPRLVRDAEVHVPVSDGLKIAVDKKLLLMRLFQAKYELIRATGPSDSRPSSAAIAEKEQAVEDLEREVAEISSRLRWLKRRSVYCCRQELADIEVEAHGGWMQANEFQPASWTSTDAAASAGQASVMTSTWEGDWDEDDLCMPNPLLRTLRWRRRQLMPVLLRKEALAQEPMMAGTLVRRAENTEQAHRASDSRETASYA